MACDRCGRSSAEIPVQHYAIESPVGRSEVDLCTDDAEGLLALLADFPAAHRARRRTVEVVAVEDIPKKKPPSRPRKP